jgi:formate dehydrogenase subunit gamma
MIIHLLALTALAVMFAAVAAGQEKPGVEPISRDDIDSCMECHSSILPVNLAALSASPHKEFKCQDCHTSVTGTPHTLAMLKEKTTCATCHPDQQEAYAKSVHARPDKAPGDHPTCVRCHGNGDPHAIRSLKVGTAREMADKRKRNVALCSACHRQSWRMSRFGPDTDAVRSYEESFHGKALLRFGNTKVAICTDCHRHHDVLAPNDPQAPTNRNNAAKTCSQNGCHVGAKVNFAMSGANHLRLKLKESLILRLELFFFRALIFGVVAAMLTVILLDLRRELFGPVAPVSGRTVAAFISVGYLFIIATLALATLEANGAYYTWLTGIGMLVLAFAVYFLARPVLPKRSREREYPRLPLGLRIQHILLMVSFTVLALTGLPMRFAQAEEAPKIYHWFGGFAVARYSHRVAAVVLILTWLWHLGWLFLRWHRAGYSLKSWTMWPNRKDLADFRRAVSYYLGLGQEEPRYGRFQFREKMDYLAEYWGIPIMVVTGLMLWFPIYWGNRLPEIGLSFAYIAHSYEATLAFLAIVTWHLYNAHFNPSTFPMNWVWITGKMTREEMEREHPLELAALEEKGVGNRV